MVGVALKDTTPDALIELVLALEQIVLEADESLFEFNSEKLDQIVRGLLEIVRLIGILLGDVCKLACHDRRIFGFRE